MGRVNEVLAVEDDQIRYGDGSDDDGIADRFSPSGDDAPPLPGDDVSLQEGAGTGDEHALGYDDQTAKKAANGEKRIYSRTPAGALAAEFWLKGDGSYVITNLLAPAGGSFEMRADGTAVINGVEISPTGSVTVPEGAALGNAALDLINHTHATAGTGAPSPPVPFPIPPP